MHYYGQYLLLLLTLGNMDRHHYELFSDFQNNTFTLLFDNGRG